MDFFAHHLLSVILYTPLVGALLLLFVPREKEGVHRVVGNLFGVLGFLVSLPLLRWFKPAGAASHSKKTRRGFLRLARGITSALTASAFCW